MKKFEKETIQAQLTAEDKCLKELEKAYKQARTACQEKIRQLNARTDMQNLQSIIHQKRYQEALLKQIDSVLNDLQTHTYKTANDFFRGSYQNGYIGSMYELHKQGIPITMPVSTQKMITAIQTDSKLSRGYYMKQGLSVQNIKTLKRQIAMEATRGIAAGKSWLEVAESLSIQRTFAISESDAMRIVRTEGNRINQQARLDAGDEAIKQGCDLLKQWDATLDEVTRPAHREADGQIVEWEEDFTVGGEKMRAPSVGGSAANVINCRCQLLKRPRWALDEEELERLKKRAEFFGLDKTKSFEDYKQKFLQIRDEQPKNPVLNKFGKEIEFDSKVSDKSKEIIERLSSEYDTRVQFVKVGSSKSAGSVDVGGATMRLSSKKGDIPIHEFAHTLASQYDDKIGVSHDKEFWKEISKIRRQYLKDVKDDPSRWISSYEHSSKGLDEFFAEAFTHAKMKEWGMTIPDHYGSDFTYSDQVLKVADKYFKKKGNL